MMQNLHHMTAPARRAFQDIAQQIAPLLHEHWQHISADLIGYAGLRGPLRNLLDSTGQRTISRAGRIYLEPFESMWLVDG